MTFFKGRCIFYTYSNVSPSSRGLGQRVLIPSTGVRLPLEMPFFCLFSGIFFSSPIEVAAVYKKVYPDWGISPISPIFFAESPPQVVKKSRDGERQNFPRPTILFGVQGRAYFLSFAPNSTGRQIPPRPSLSSTRTVTVCFSLFQLIRSVTGMAKGVFQSSAVSKRCLPANLPFM